MSKLGNSSVYYRPTFIIICIIYGMCVFSNLTNVRGFDSLIQLPGSGASIDRPSSMGVFSVDDYGARGDGLTDDTKAFINIWEMACSSSSQLKIVIPSGNTYLVRPTDFGGPCQSRVTLSISGNIVAPKDPRSWDGLNPQKWLYFHGVNHLTIEGGGTINGMGQEWWARSCKINTTNPCHHAPTALVFHRCNYLKVCNLMMVNSQQMHMAFTNCVQVAASYLRVVAPAVSPNTDGIHISSCTRVELMDSIIKTGDDCISIVGNSSLIQIQNISCGPGHGISIGSLGKSDSLTQVHDINVNGAFLSNTENGVRIKTWQGGNGAATKIRFQNVLMKNVSNPIIIDQYYCDSSLPCPNRTLAVTVDNISFINIKGTSATVEAIRFACSDSLPCTRLYLEDIKLVSYSGGNTKSFCWHAKGSSSGLIYPPPCFSNNEGFIQQNVPSRSVVWSI